MSIDHTVGRDDVVDQDLLILLGNISKQKTAKAVFCFGGNSGNLISDFPVTIPLYDE
jgi:hypothetical protein